MNGFFFIMCTYSSGKVTNVLVEIFVIQLVHNGRLNVTLQIGQVHHHSGDRIAWSTNGHQHLIVVAVAIDVVALAVHFAVDVVAQQGAVEFCK